MTHEEAVQLLCSMFESWDRETLMAVFESNGYHVERTIESIIGMEQPELVNQTQNVEPQNTLNEAYGTGTRHHARSEPLLDFDEPTPQVNTTSTMQSKQRGAPVQLPPDFLRLPQRNNKDQAFLADEQLALMLQNELFQEQVDQLLGNDFREGLRRNQGQFQGQRGGQSRGTGQRGTQGSSDTSGDIMGIPDMGILTGLKNMGEGMKKQLNQLALNFNSKGNSTSRPQPLDEEARPLTGMDYEEEDEEEEDYGNYNSGALRQRHKKND